MQPSWISVPSQTNRGVWGVVFPRIQGSHQITLHNLSGLQRSWQCSWIHTTKVFCILFDDFQYLHILWHDLLEVQGWCCNHHLHDVASAWKIQRPPVQSAGKYKDFKCGNTRLFWDTANKCTEYMAGGRGLFAKKWGLLANKFLGERLFGQNRPAERYY